eukprot:7386886-Prymnesium_polylepis.1
MELEEANARYDEIAEQLDRVEGDLQVERSVVEGLTDNVDAADQEHQDALDRIQELLDNTSAELTKAKDRINANTDIIQGKQALQSQAYDAKAAMAKEKQKHDKAIKEIAWQKQVELKKIEKDAEQQKRDAEAAKDNQKQLSDERKKVIEADNSLKELAAKREAALADTKEKNRHLEAMKQISAEQMRIAARQRMKAREARNLHGKFAAETTQATAEEVQQINQAAASTTSEEVSKGFLQRIFGGITTTQWVLVANFLDAASGGAVSSRPVFTSIAAVLLWALVPESGSSARIWGIRAWVMSWFSKGGGNPMSFGSVAAFAASAGTSLPFGIAPFVGSALTFNAKVAAVEAIKLVVIDLYDQTRKAETFSILGHFATLKQWSHLLGAISDTIIQNTPASVAALFSFDSGNWAWILAGTAILAVAYKYRKYRLALEDSKKVRLEVESMTDKRLRRFGDMLDDSDSDGASDTSSGYPVSRKSMELAVRMLNGHKPLSGKGPELAVFFAVIPMLVAA